MADEQIVTRIVAKADLSSLVSEVHRASASLQQLQRELLASNRAISSSTKLANNLFRDTLTGSGQYSSHFVNLNSDVDKFGKNLDAGRLKLRNYFSTFREHATTQKGMIRELAKEQVMLQNAVLQPLGRNAQGLMQYNVMIPRGLDAVKNSAQLARMEMQIMNRALSEGAGSLINWGKNTQWAGRQLTVGLTVPLTMFGAAAGKAFREADQELVRLTKVYGGLAATSATELKRVREEVVETAKTLSKTMGASFKDTIALGADIAATGQMGNELLDSITETTRLSILGEVDRQDAMKATLSIQTAFKQNTQELTESINFLNAVENQTSTTLGDLVEAIPKAGPVIQQLGGDVKDLALYLTAMREGGINASEGANALKSGLASLINPTKQTVGMMSDFGIDVMGMVAKNTGDTTGLLMDLQKALDSLDPLSKARAMEQMFGKFQFARMSALLNNLGKEGSQTLQVLNLMKATTGELADIASRELKMITESASGKYKRAIEGLKAELADVGEEFLGVATKLITAATKILDFFTGLPAPIKKALTFLAGFTALVGPLIMLTGVLANFFGYITKGIVQLRAFFMKANGWKMLTPEIIAAQKAAEMVETAFYSDAAAAQVLHNALQKLVLDYQNLQAASAKNAVPVNPGVSTVGGAPIMVAGRRVVDPSDPYVGDPNTRAMSHINPRDPNNPATIFGGVPGAIPVNRGISRTPQIYMHDRLPDYEGLTSIKGISTGIVPGEAAKHHALMATLGMQSQQEIAALKKTIAMGGTVSRELLDTFDDILPITQRFADSAATQSAAIVQQMRNAEITVEQAKARIIALNAQIEADMGAAVTAYAAGRGRTIDLTRAPMMDQPVVDANGQFTLRDLYKKKANAAVMNEFGRLRGIRTFGAPYSIQTTRPPRFNTGGEIESFGPNKTVVSGPSSVNYDDRLGSVPLGGYVLNQQASMDPANAALVAMAPSTYLNDGGSITAALTPREVVFGPQIQRMPDLYAAVDAANNGYNFGGQIMNGVAGYGKKTANTPGTKMDERLFKKQYKEYLRFINNPRYEDDMRIRMIMLDAAELSYTAKMPMDKAIQTATSNFDSAKMQSGGSDEQFVKLRIKQVQDLEKKHPELKVKNAKTADISSSKALNYNLNKVRDAMLRDQRFAGVHDLIAAVSPTTFKNKKGMPIIQGLHDRAHFRRRGSLGYMTSGYMGLAAVLPSGINNIMSRLETLGLSRDVLNLNAADARENFALALKRTGMDKFATVDDLYAAVMDDGKFKTKAQIESGTVVKANRKQRNSWSMFLEAAATRQRWIPGRPPRLVPAGYNLGGMIPGGSISKGRLNYGNLPTLLRLLTPSQQLKVLEHARSMSFTGRSNYPQASYSHILSPSTGHSFPVPGVGGVYDDQQKNRVFFKAVPNEPSLVAETHGTAIGRILRLITPVQTRKTIRNPYDPTGKSKFRGAESPYDEGFINPNTAVASKFTQDEVLDQFIASLIFANKDLSRANVHGRRLADVGNAGVLAKASMNDDYAKTMPSMEEMAMINLLQVKGGARKDFARDTAPIIGQMTPRQYGAAIKKKMEEAYPELKRYVYAIPKRERKPYLALLERFEAGMEVNWAKYQPMHANPKYLNSGGPVGGPIKRGRSAYGRKGNPAARAEQERLKAERAASYRGSTASSYTATGNPQMQVARVPYVGGTGVRGNAYTGVPTESMARTVSTMRLAKFPHMNMPTMPMNIPVIGNTAAISAAFASMGTSIKRDSMQLANAININARVIAMSTKAAAQSLVNNVKTQATSMVNATKSMTARVVSASKAQALKMQAAGSAFYNGVVQQQNAFAARHYPPGMAPAQGFMGPGYIGRYKDLGDGVQSRKVGSLGFRKTEYLVNNASTGGHTVPMSAAQARANGVQVPQRQGMGMGMGMGIGMAGSMAGMTLMGKEKVKILGTEMSGMTAGMGVMAASSILPFLPLTKFLTAAKAGAIGLGRGLKTIQMGALTLTKVFAGVMRFIKGFGPIGILITIATAAFKLYKHFKDESQDATMGLSLTSRAAEEAGVKYFNLKEQMQGYLDKADAVRAAGQAAKNNGIGMPGLPQSVEDIKKAKEEGKGLKDLIESINRSASPEESKRLLTSTKAQFIAGGMSVEEANRKIYGALLNSKKSMEAFDLLGNSAFGKITDKSTAAEYAVGNLINTINKGSGMVDWGKEITAGFEGLINTFEAARAGLVGTKDEMGNVIDEYKAYEMVMSSSEKMYPGFNDAIGTEVYENLAKTQPILAGISNEADSLKGILAKYALFTAQIGIDLSKIDSGLAIKLAGFTEAIGSGIAQLTKAGDSATTFGTVGSALEKLKKTIGSVSAATQRSAAAAQRSAQEELKLIAKKIKLIDDEKNKKLEALRATQEASNYALELQKLQIEYADAVSRGDMARANQAKLDIDQLTLNRQSELAQKAIEDAAEAAKAPLEKKSEGIQEASDKKAVALQNAQDRAAVAQEIASKLTTFQQQYNDLTQRAVQSQYLPDEERVAEENKIKDSLVALIKEIQVAGTGNTALAKVVRDGFSKYFDKDGKAVDATVTTKPTGSPTGFDKNGKPIYDTTTTINPNILNQFNRDVAAVADIAKDITGGTTLDRLRIALLKALGYKDKTEGISAFSTGTTADRNTLGKKGEKGVAETITNQLTGDKEYLQEGYYSAAPSLFKGGGRNLQPGDILQVGPNGSIIALSMGSAGVKKTGSIRIESIDRNASPPVLVWTVNKAAGGHITGPGTGTSDSIPAMLSHGEYVVKASSVAKYGVSTLDAINTQKFHKGGAVHAHLPDGTHAPSQISLGNNRYVPVMPTGTLWKKGMDEFYSPPTKDYGISDIKSPMGSLRRFLDIARSQIGSGHNYRLHDWQTPDGGFGDQLGGAEPGDMRFFDKGLTDTNKFNIWGNKKFGIGDEVSWWCGQFVAWVADKAGVELSDKMHSAWQATQQYKKKGLFNDLTKKNNYKNIKVGDLAWFDYAQQESRNNTRLIRDGIPDHATIVSGVNKHTVNTIGWYGDGDEVKEIGYSIKDLDLFGSVSPTFKKPQPIKLSPIDPNLQPSTTVPFPTSDTSTASSTVPGATIPIGFADGGPVDIESSIRSYLKKKTFGSFPKKPTRTRIPAGMGIDKDPMRYAGSGASMGGIGSGIYGFGPLMLSTGGMVERRNPDPSKISIKPDGKLSTMITAAESMVGYREGEDDNDTFFGKWQNDRDKNINSRFISWCGAFMNWVANASGVPLDNMVYTPAGAQKFKGKDDYHTEGPQVGDMAFFNYDYDNNKPGKDRIQHIGLVRKILSDSKLQTIEGNTSEVAPPLVFPKGYEAKEYYDEDRTKRIRDGVFRRERLYNHPDSSIVGFGRPKYKGETNLGGLLINSGQIPRLPNIGRDPHSLYAASLNGYANGGPVKGYKNGGLFGGIKNKISGYFNQFGKNTEAVDKAPETRKYTEGILKGLIKYTGPLGMMSTFPGGGKVADKFINFAYDMVGKPVEEILAGSGTKGDYLWTGLNFVPGSSLLKGAKGLKGAATIAKASVMETAERAKNTVPLLKSFNPFAYSSIKASEKGNLPLTEVFDNTVLFPKLLNKLMDGGALALTPAKSAYSKIIKDLNSVAEDFTRGMGGVPDYPWIATDSAKGTGLTIDTPKQLAKAHQFSKQISDGASKGFWALVERSKAYLTPNADNPAFYQHKGAGLHMPDLKKRINSLGQMVRHPHASAQTLLHELGHRDHGILGGKWKDLGGLLSLYVGDELSPTAIRETYSDLFSHRAIKTLRDRISGPYAGLKSRWDESLAYNLPHGTSSDPIEFSSKLLDNLWASLHMGMRERGYQVHSAFMETSANMMKIFEPGATGPQSETYLGIGEFLRSHGIINGSDNFEALADMARNLDWEELIPQVMSATKPNRLTSMLSKMPPLGLPLSPINYLEDKVDIDMDKIMGAISKMLTAPGLGRGNNVPGNMFTLPRFEAGINMVPADMLALIHKNEAVVPAHMNPFNPNATSSAIASGSVYNISVELNGTNVTAQDVATQIHREMKLKEMAAGVNRRVGP